MWAELEKVIKEIIGYYEMMYVLNKKKQSMLASIEMTELSRIVRKEEEIVELISKAESRRQKILMELAAATEGLAPTAKSRDLYRFMPDNFKSRLAKCHDDLDKIVRKVRELSENNKLLITSALSAVNYHLNRISGSAVDPVYGEGGKEVVTSDKKFDFKA